MASLFYRLTYSALTASLLIAPSAGLAQGVIATQPLPAVGTAAPPTAPTTTAPTPSAPATPAPTPTTPATTAGQPTPRPLDDDSYVPPAATPGAAEVPPPVNEPPPGAAQPTQSSGPTQAPMTPAVVAPPAQPAPVRHAPPRPATEVKLSVDGPVEPDADKSRPVKVARGETVNIIADRLGVPREALIKANRLKKPYALDVGQTLKVPTPKDYVIQTGDTLMAVSRRFGVSPAVLGEINGFDIGDRLHAGQKLALPEGVHDAGPVKTVVPVPGGRAHADEEPETAPSARAPATVATPVEQEPSAPVTGSAEPSHPVPYHEAPPVRPSAPSEAEPRVRLSVQGHVVEDRVGSREMRAGAGDTVNIIADRLLTPREDFIKINHLKKPYALDVGQILKVPTPKVYVAESGDTLALIGRRFGLTASALAEINDMDDDQRPRPGAKIALPINVHDNGPIRTVIAPQRASHRYGGDDGGTDYGRIAPPTRYASPPAYSGPPVADTTPAPTDAAISAAGHGRFIWPLAGQLLSGYGPKPGGQRNDGVDLAAPVGAPVMAAGEGDVVYAGNLAEFGNLVLIRDDDGWVTAYAHLSHTEVKIRDHVRRGDEIGQVGQTGAASQPELHFEIRYASNPKDKARPIDPMLVLPAR